MQFGIKPFQMKKAELLASNNEFIVEQYKLRRKILLIVDEAQNLSSRVLGEIRMLSGIETTKEKVRRIVRAGQPELNQKLDSPELAQLTQRVRLRFHLPALSAPEMQSYILHRLDVAGAQGREVFAPDTFAFIFRYSGGVPRLTNTLCDTALLAAFNRGRDIVELQDVHAAIDELQWVEFSRRNGVRPTRPEPDIRPESDALPPASGVRSPSARILIAIDGRTVSSRALHAGRLVIGRARAADLHIESHFVSRHHCQIVTTAQSCVIEELNSTNGIVVQAKRVRHLRLRDGDVVFIGDHKLLYFDERPRSHGGMDEYGETGVLDDSLESSTDQRNR